MDVKVDNHTLVYTLTSSKHISEQVRVSAAQPRKVRKEKGLP